MSEGPETLRRSADDYYFSGARVKDIIRTMIRCAAQWERERADEWVVRRAAQITGLTAEMATTAADLIDGEFPARWSDPVTPHLRKYAKLAQEDE